MEYLLLWSGDIAGMKKVRIPAIKAMGILSHADKDGNLVAPDRVAIRAALPYRLRAAFNRSNMGRMVHTRRDMPMMFEIRTTRVKWLTQLYLQP